MQHSLRSFLRLRLRCPACLANRLAALWAGWQAPQCFSTCLSVPGFAWLDRTDSKQASACWSVSVGGSPLETCGFSPASAGLENATAGSEASRSDEGALSRYAKRIVEGPMQRSLTLTPPASPTLSVFPGGSPMALREKRQRSLTLTPSASPTLSVFPGGSPVALRAGWRCSPASAEVENAQHGGILLDSACRFPARVEFQACFRQKPTAAHFSFTAMAFSCP